MHHDSIHRDLLVRGAEILRRARAVVEKQEALIARLRADGQDTLHAEAVLELYKQALQIFQQTFAMITRKHPMTVGDEEALRQLMSRLSHH
jgi:hypothetical protein